MDDRLQRRLRAADPLAAGTGQTPDPAQLDATKERILMNQMPQPAVAPARPRKLALPVGLGAVAAVAIVAVVVVGQLARPAAALAFDPTPTPVSGAQLAAATAACSEGLQLGTLEGSGTVSVPADGAPRTGTIKGTGGDVAPDASGAAVALPPLVALELHGTGAVAVFGDDATIATCMLMEDGGGWVRGPVSVAPNPASTPGVVAGGGSVTSFAGKTITVVGGTAPAGAVTMRVEGGPADGATATVTKGGYGLWIPGDASTEAATLVALDAAGHELMRVPLLGGPAGS